MSLGDIIDVSWSGDKLTIHPLVDTNLKAEHHTMLARAIVIGIGLAIMYPALIYHGIISIYPPPKPIPVSYAMPTDSPEERNAKAATQKRNDEEFRAAMSAFAKILLIAATAFGVVAILGGSLLPGPAISAGVIAGGAIAVGVGYWSYSNFLPEGWRFASLLAGSLSLAWVGYRQWRDDWL